MLFIDLVWLIGHSSIDCAGAQQLHSVSRRERLNPGGGVDERSGQARRRPPTAAPRCLRTYPCLYLPASQRLSVSHLILASSWIVVGIMSGACALNVNTRDELVRHGLRSPSSSLILIHHHPLHRHPSLGLHVPLSAQVTRNALKPLRHASLPRPRALRRITSKPLMHRRFLVDGGIRKSLPHVAYCPMGLEI